MSLWTITARRGAGEKSRVHSEGIDVVGEVESRFALGFQVFDHRFPALGPDAFGHAGAAGALAFASPRHGMAYAYIRSRFALGESADRENTMLIEEVLRSLDNDRTPTPHE